MYNNSNNTTTLPPPSSPTKLLWTRRKKIACHPWHAAGENAEVSIPFWPNQITHLEWVGHSLHEVPNTTTNYLVVLMGTPSKMTTWRSNNMQLSVVCRGHVSTLSYLCTLFSFPIFMQTAKEGSTNIPTCVWPCLVLLEKVTIYAASPCCGGVGRMMQWLVVGFVGVGCERKGITWHLSAQWTAPPTTQKICATYLYIIWYIL